MRRIDLWVVAALLAAAVLGVGYAQQSTLTPRAPIFIIGNAGFTAANGVVKGLGTQANPYVIERWEINAAGSPYGIYIENTDAYFIIRVCWIYGADQAGIYSKNVENGKVEKCNVPDNAKYGIYLHSSSSNVVSGNITNSNGCVGIVLHDSSNDNEIFENIALENGHLGLEECHINLAGINLLASSNNEISRNKTDSNKQVGIFLGGSSNNDISGNTMHSNDLDGIALYHSSNENQIFENAIGLNGRNGIFLLVSSNGNKISKNTISNNNTGISLSESSDNKLFENTLQWNTDYGMHLEGSTNNLIHGNNLIENGTNAWDNGTNQWDGGSQGNYWSDYTGVDTDGNEIGDTPYNIQGDANQDNYPMMNPYP